MFANPRRKTIASYFGIVILNIALFTLIYTLIPSLRNALVGHNQILDSITIVVLLFTIVVGFRYILLISPRWYRILYLIIPLIALLSLVGEFGYEVGVFDAFTPIMIFGTPIDSMQELADIGKAFVSDVGFVPILLISAIVFIILAVVGFFVLRYLRRIENFDRWAMHNIPLLIFLAGFGVFTMISVAIDLHLLGEHRRFTIFLEELAEVNMAISLMFGAIYYATLSKVFTNQSDTSNPMPQNATSSA